MIRMLDPYAVARPEWVGAGELYRMQLRDGRGAVFWGNVEPYRAAR